MTDMRPILIAGPTASGKSALALRIAEETGGVIVNADSMQVYRELPILSARPSAADEARAPHRLYGHVPASEAYSVGRFVREAQGVLAEILGEGRRPVFVGGTGLYFKALLEGLSPIPAIPPAIREHWRAEADRKGAAKLHRKLLELDPVTASRLQPSDPQRIVRALEVLDATGRPLWEWQNEPGFDEMMRRGALEEARGISKLGLDPALPSMRALGLRPLLAHLAGDLDREEAVAEAKAETRRYIKRQATWINGNMKSWNRLSAQQMESIGGDIVAFIDSLP